MIVESQSDSLFGLLVSTAWHGHAIGDAIPCEALAAPMHPDAADTPGWRPAWLGVASGIVQLRDAGATRGIVNHEYGWGMSVYLRFATTQLELALKEANQVSGPALARARRLVGSHLRT